METNTPIDHKRVQGIIVFVAGILISRFTDWEIGTEDLTFGVGEGMYIIGLLWSYFGGWVAQGPIDWSFGGETLRVDPNSVAVMDRTKLTEAENTLFDKLMEKGQ